MTPYEKILARLDQQDLEMTAITQEMLTLRQAIEDRLPPIPKPGGRRDIVHTETPRTYQQAMEQNQMLIDALNEAYTHMDEENERASWKRKRQGSAQTGAQQANDAKAKPAAVVTTDKPTDVHIRLKVSVETV